VYSPFVRHYNTPFTRPSLEFYTISNQVGLLLHRTYIPRSRFMKMLVSPVLLLVAGLLAVFGSGGGATNPSNTRLLTSITLSPATADAQTFPNGQVQFSAVGHFNTMPAIVDPFHPSSWLSTSGNVATVDQNGLAQCVPGASGTVQIQGIAPMGPGDSPATRGIATLTCP
jgi:hypothetical protein